MGFEEVTRPYKSSNLPGYTGYCPRLRFKCGRTYGADTDKLTRLHTKNEKLNPLKAISSTSTRVQLPSPTGDNKLTANMVPGYTGYVPIHTPGYIYGTRYKESTEEALEKFLQTNAKQRSDQQDLAQTAASAPSLRKRYDFHDPAVYPDLNPMYSKNYRTTDRKDFLEPPVLGYTGFVPNIEQFGLGQRYTKWTEEGLEESVKSRLRQEHLLTQRIDLKRPDCSVPENLKSFKGNPSLGVLYRKKGMLPKYTGYIPCARFRYGKTYGNTTREGPACADPHGYAAGKYITFPVV
ncbi:protein FAM166B-like isoform X2 [Dendronephthya gigantea]|uniref:protein FAM166B-like isoform X2 n=1 Tax=Dendronephthya gigantea TaxID=151771 RepID=UPI00106A2B0F|nr:protein FAM166B-like isoform X2 [Dendronephthya gigantea]